MAPGTRPRPGRWGWIQAQAGQADDSNSLVPWTHLRKRRRSPKRLLSRPRMRSEPLHRRVHQKRMGTARQRRWSELWTSTEGQLAVRALPNKGWFFGGQMLHRMPRRPAFALVRAHVEPPAGIEPATPSLPYRGGRKLMATVSNGSQVAKRVSRPLRLPAVALFEVFIS